MVVFTRNSDFLTELEDFMASAGHGLMIKFGLGQAPSPEKVQEWASLTRQYMREGKSQEAAGEAAAKQLFRDYNTHFYLSEADMIEMLLQQAGNK
jgi:hypothetical protein